MRDTGCTEGTVREVSFLGRGWTALYEAGVVSADVDVDVVYTHCAISPLS